MKENLEKRRIDNIEFSSKFDPKNVYPSSNDLIYFEKSFYEIFISIPNFISLDIISNIFGLKKIYFIDINKNQIIYHNYVVKLIKNSKSLEDFRFKYFKSEFLKISFWDQDENKLNSKVANRFGKRTFGLNNVRLNLYKKGQDDVFLANHWGFFFNKKKFENLKKNLKNADIIWSHSGLFKEELFYLLEKNRYCKIAVWLSNLYNIDFILQNKNSYIDAFYLAYFKMNYYVDFYQDNRIGWGNFLSIENRNLPHIVTYRQLKSIFYKYKEILEISNENKDLILEGIHFKVRKYSRWKQLKSLNNTIILLHFPMTHKLFNKDKLKHLTKIFLKNKNKVWIIERYCNINKIYSNYNIERLELLTNNYSVRNFICKIK
jgi:hypothetical protein